MNPTDEYACLYTRYKGNDLYLMIIIYVDDIFLMTGDDETTKMAMVVLRRILEMQNIGPVRFFI